MGIHWSTVVDTKRTLGHPQPGWSTCLPLPTASRFTHRPCPVTTSRASAWAFPNALRASHTYGAWSSRETPEERGEAGCWEPTDSNSASTQPGPAHMQGIRGDGGGCCWTSPYSSVEWDRDEYVAELLACATHMTVRSSCWPVLEEAFSIIRMISHLIME